MLRPRFTKISLKRAASDAITRSQPSARLSPAPAATPFTLAMVGLGMPAQRGRAPPDAPHVLEPVPGAARHPRVDEVGARAEARVRRRSPPARGRRGCARPRRTRRAARPTSSPVIAFILSGRLSVSVTTPSARSTRRSDIGRYRSGVGLNPFRSQAKRSSDIVDRRGRARGDRGAGPLGRVRLIGPDVHRAEHARRPGRGPSHPARTRR